MDLLTAETSETSEIVKKKKSRFRSLKLVNVNLDDSLSEKPFGVDYGRLDNGLTYYVRSNSKPKMRAALALAVKAGSVLEEDEERGVAHIVEHLAFSATTNYSNHDLIKFLESIGAEFGACQNALTSADETVYELFVPVDKPELLSQALLVLAEFSTEVRLSDHDLEKERGAVMEEYRGSRNATGRMQDDHWVLMMEGSKYAERLPIGLEKIIRTVSSEVVKQFYRKWYNLQNMAVIAVGDFPDAQSVVELIKAHFGHKIPAPDPLAIPHFTVPSHEEPRFSCSVESEAAGSAVMISCKVPVEELKTVKDYRNLLKESMFFHALNQRFFKISRKKDPPFFSCSAAADVLVRPVKAYIMTSSCKEKGTIEALESMLTEVARVRVHGFSEREIAVVRALLMSEIESVYLERDQLQSTNLRDEYLQHFLRDEPVIGVEYEAQLHKSLLPSIAASEVSQYAEDFRTSCSCVIKTIEPHSWATVDRLKAVVLKVNSLEEDAGISPWDDEHIPEEIVSLKPNPGSVIQQTEYSVIGATELVLSNGIRVCYKCTDFLDDQVLFTGFSYGGLSELPESDYFSCSMGPTIAGEIGVFGYRPSVLMDMLAGKRAEVGTKLGAYMRTFSGDCSPSDLETALQLVYQLFTTNLEPGEDDINIVMQMAEEAVRAQERDPYTVFANRVRELNYGNSYFFRPIRQSDLQKVDPFKACDFFNRCFKDPSTFTVVIVGNIDPSITLPLIVQYLGGIPRPVESSMSFNRDDLKGLPFTFPSSTIREIVYSPMVEAQCSVQLCFPVELKNGNMGLSAGLLRQATYTTARLGSFKMLTNKAVEANDGRPLPLYQKALCGLTAGAIGACVGSPADLALIRMQADATLPAAQRRNYTNAFHALRRIVGDEGFLSLWKGAGPTVVRAMALNMGMLASYDQSVEFFRDSVGLGEVSTVVGASAVSGLAAAACSLPFDFIKTQIQKMQPDAEGKLPYSGSVDCALKTLRSGGPFKFYTGFPVYCIRIAPHVMMTWIFLSQIQKVEKKIGL